MPKRTPATKITKVERELRRKKLSRESTAQNPRPVQHRDKNSNKSIGFAALKVADTPLSHAFRHIEPTWRNYIYYANLSAQNGNDEMKKFMESYTPLPPKERQSVMPDTICDLAGVQPGDLIAAVAKELWQHKQSESTITASMRHPEVIETTAKAALNKMYGYKDRELFLRITGSLPDKKGASIVIHNTPQTATFNGSSLAGANGFKPMDQRVIDMGKFLDEPAETLAVPMLKDDSVFAEIDDEED